MVELEFEQLDIFVEGVYIEEGTDEAVNFEGWITNPTDDTAVIESFTGEDVKSYRFTFMDYEAPFKIDFQDINKVYKVVQVLEDYDFNIESIVNEYLSAIRADTDILMSEDDKDDYIDSLSPERAFWFGRMARIDSSDSIFKLDGNENLVSLNDDEAVKHITTHFHDFINEDLDALGY